MKLGYNCNCSQLAELMGNGYYDVDAANFAVWLLEERDITDTDQVSDAAWADLLLEWEIAMGITLRGAQ